MSSELFHHPPRARVRVEYVVERRGRSDEELAEAFTATRLGAVLERVTVAPIVPTLPTGPLLGQGAGA